MTSSGIALDRPPLGLAMRSLLRADFMALFSDVLNQDAWSSQDTYSLLACAGYIAVFAFIGIRWFRWDSR